MGVADACITSARLRRMVDLRNHIYVTIEQRVGVARPELQQMRFIPETQQ
jgi:hypothetical protein